MSQAEGESDVRLHTVHLLKEKNKQQKDPWLPAEGSW